MSEREVIDACLKVVSNRCRNLRKAIDRAKTWEQAAASGQELNPEQMESVKSCVKKEALLAELQEILKKQTTVVESPERADQKQQTSKRSAKAAKAKEKRAKASQVQGESTTSSADGTHRDDDSDLSIPTQEKNRTRGTTDESSEVPPSSQVLMTEFQALKNDNESLRQELEKLKSTIPAERAKVKKENVRKVLNLFHVVDFLRQPGSREALLSYSQAQTDKAPAYITELDMDLLCYFNVMLTSPNGNVPHDEAVDVSTLHCLEFLQNSNLDAFKDTSYAALNNIVGSIATSPILTDRGRDELPNAALFGDLHDGLNGNTPGYEVNNAHANVSVP